MGDEPRKFHGAKVQFSTFYDDVAEFPDEAPLPRFTGIWYWMLYDNVVEIRKRYEECCARYAQVLRFPKGARSFPITNYHRVYMREEDPILKTRIELLKESLRKYAKDARQAAAIMNMPNQPKRLVKRFENFPGLFAEGRFGPTGENEEHYKENHGKPDTFVMGGDGKQDALTPFLAQNVHYLTNCFGRRLRSKRKLADVEYPLKSRIEFDTVHSLGDWLACFYVPLWFTASIAVLLCLRPTKIRIVVLGILGILFAISIKLMGGSINRSEIFGITAAFYAVVGIFAAASTAISK